jgi:transposase-like protein
MPLQVILAEPIVRQLRADPELCLNMMELNRSRSLANGAGPCCGKGRASMAQAARKITAKDANQKLAHRRLTVLELAERLGNVAEACRRGCIDRTSFYEWKRRFQLEGLDGLKDLPPIAKNHPMTTPPEVVARIEALALLHPAYGCKRLEALLALEGRRLSAITIQKILNDKGLGTRHERWLALERTNAEQAIELTPEQAAFLEKLNPCFKGRHVESDRPGQLLSVDTSWSAPSKASAGPICTPWSTPSASCTAPKQPETPVAVLHNDVLPFYHLLDHHPDRQRPRVLWHRASLLGAQPGAQRHPAQKDQGRLAAHQRLRRALQPHRAGGVLPADHAQPALRDRRRAAGRPRRLATPFNHERPPL